MMDVSLCQNVRSLALSHCHTLSKPLARPYHLMMGELESLQSAQAIFGVTVLRPGNFQGQAVDLQSH